MEFVFDVGDGEDFEIDVGFEKYFVLLLVEGELFDAVAWVRFDYFEDGLIGELFGRWF